MNNEDKIISLVSAKSDDEALFESKERENHFYLKTFLSYNEAVDFVEDVLSEYDDGEYYVGILEIRNINHAYQAGLSIFRRQGDLFLDSDD